MSNTSQMFAIYEFVNVEKKYRHVIIPTGEYFALGEMSNRYYTFQSKANDQVALNIAVKNTQDYDALLEFIFVYDGGDVRNCRMIGRLSSFLKKKRHSTSSNLTIVNLYDVKSPSFLIGNDLSKVSVFSKYKAILTSRNQQTTGELFDASDQGAAYTWICSDCQNFYWTVLKFHKSTTTIPKAYIELRSLSPTHNTPALLNYSVSSNLNQYFPQLIPSRMFTMINHYSGIAVTLDTSTSKPMTQRWLRPYDGRKGTIFSPSVWDPKTSPYFSFQFEDHNLKFMFGVNVKDVRIAAPGESLTIKTGPNNNFSYKEL
uniref:FBA_1 domain-containing protein n=1 Tax=Caenorhabditis tropicalis TaxID=1561998 RepID=A0A1I7U288_9PELO